MQRHIRHHITYVRSDVEDSTQAYARVSRPTVSRRRRRRLPAGKLPRRSTGIPGSRHIPPACRRRQVAYSRPASRQPSGCNHYDDRRRKRSRVFTAAAAAAAAEAASQKRDRPRWRQPLGSQPVGLSSSPVAATEKSCLRGQIDAVNSGLEVR
jgi:hypothetical protein